MIVRQIILILIATLLVAGTVAAEPRNFHNALSLQGFTGVLNTPNAHVTEEGWLYAVYANQEENKWRHKVSFQDDYQFSIGMFNFMEIGGRFFEAPGAGRDLSANFKFTTAFLTEDRPLLPVLAAGVQDVGGGAALLQSKYVVVSQDIWRLRLSAGYGSGPDRMDGVFAGGEVKLHDWVYLLGDYDSAETNVGARVIFPQFWKIPTRFTATVKTSLDYRAGKNYDVGVGLTVPLDFRVKRAREAAPVRSVEIAAQPSSSIREPGATSSSGAGSMQTAEPAELTPAPETAKEVQQESLQAALVDKGFVNVVVGVAGRSLVVEYENVRFNHNELDALGVVAGMATQAAPDGIDTLHLVIRRRNIAVATITLPVDKLRAYLVSGEGLQELQGAMTFETGARLPRDLRYTGPRSNSSFLHTSASLAPGLVTFIGTEVGAFDYLLSLKPEINAQLWKGALVTARWDIPVSWSENLESGRAYRSSRNPSQMDRLMLFQALSPAPSVLLQLGAGMVLPDRYGMLNEAVWRPAGGEHQFRVAQGWNDDHDASRQGDLLIGSYRYYYAPLDMSVEGAAGKFWARDKGFSLELKRFWEDTAVSFYYKDSKGEDQKKWRAVGVQFSVPLTPRKDMKPVAKVQLRGTEEWSYAQETTLQHNNYNNPRGSLNYFAPYPLAINPQPSQALYRSFYNRDRLTESYLRQHLGRLREAWGRFGSHQTQ